jgi:hypothetical protein
MEPYSFKDVFEYSRENNRTTCKVLDCNKKFSGYVSSNLWRHLQSLHEEVYLKLVPQRETRKKSKFDKCVLDLRKSLVELCTVNGRPLSIVNDSGMKEILQIACNSVAENNNEKVAVGVFSQKQLKIDLKSAYLYIQSTIKSEVKQRLVSLMVDIRSKRGKSILGIQIQYMKADKIKIRTIGMIRMLRPHTGVYIAELIEKKLGEYGISLDQIYTLTTDNGANMLKAVSVIGKNARDLAEQESTEMDDDLFLDTDEIEDLAYNLEHDTDEHSNCAANVNENMLNSAAAIVLDVNSDIECTIGLNCGAHTLQLEIVDAINTWDTDTSLLTGCRQIMTKLKSQNMIDILVSRKLNLPINDCKPRWWSFFLMVSVMLNAPNKFFYGDKIINQKISGPVFPFFLFILV